MQSELSATEAEEVERHQAEMKRAANIVSTVNSFVHPLQDAIAVSGEKKKEKVRRVPPASVALMRSFIQHFVDMHLPLIRYASVVHTLFPVFMFLVFLYILLRTSMRMSTFLVPSYLVT